MFDDDSEHWFGGLPVRNRAPQPMPEPVEAYRGSERRADQRMRTLLAGKIVSGDGFISADCTIRDLSLSGARVEISRIVRLPPPVALLLIRDGLLFDAAVAWRRGDEAGLVFKAPHDLRTDVDPARRRVRALWTELIDRYSEP
jgi:hypothetical protein